MLEIKKYTDLITSLIQKELIMTNGDVDLLALSYILEIQYASVRVETFFTPQSLTEIAQSVFSVERKRSLILALSQKLALNLNDRDVIDLREIIVRSYAHYDSPVLMPDPIINLLKVDPDYIRDIVRDSFWLLTYFLVLISKGNLNDYSTNAREENQNSI